jgi:predicted transcriptional regulator
MRVILHIGQHKTGSKALQSALHANREWLAASGFAYPILAVGTPALRPYEMNHHALFRALRDALDAAGGGRRVAAVTDHLRSLWQHVPSGTETVILSAEDLFDTHTAHEEEFVTERVADGSMLLARAFQSMAESVRVVVYLRRQDHVLAAHYAQFIKGSNKHDLSFEAFRKQLWQRLDADRMLSAWEQAFGIEAVTVRAYEPSQMPGGIVGDFFTRLLELPPPPVTEPFPDDLEAFNITPSRDWLDYMRLLNRRSSRGMIARPRALVLEAAFRDRDTKPIGVAAWLSPGDRGRLLEHFEPGNRRIAARHGLGSDLFQERRPHEGDPWAAQPALSIERLEELDARVQKLMTASQRTKHQREKMTASVPLDGILSR